MPRLSVKRVEALEAHRRSRQRCRTAMCRGSICRPAAPVEVVGGSISHGGKTRKHTVGGYPVFGLKDARDAAVKVLRAVSEGHDPAQQRPGSVEGVVEQFLQERCKHYRPQWRREAERLFRVNVLPQWHGRKIAEITRADVKALLGDLTETPVIANRVHSILHTFFDWAVENDLITSSPVAGIKRPNKETPRDRVLTDAELRAVWLACGERRFPYGAIIQLLILTGQRRGEVAGMAWSEIDHNPESGRFRASG